jgi:hypothetical protein
MYPFFVSFCLFFVLTNKDILCMSPKTCATLQSQVFSEIRITPYGSKESPSGKEDFYCKEVV